MQCDGYAFSGNVIAGALCNGRFAGGGQELGKGAKLTDGQMQICFLKDFPKSAVAKVLKEIADYNQTGHCAGEYLVSFKSTELIAVTSQAVATNLDGEPQQLHAGRFSVEPASLKLSLPSYARH